MWEKIVKIFFFKQKNILIKLKNINFNYISNLYPDPTINTRVQWVQIQYFAYNGLKILADVGMYENSVIVFLSDNGGNVLGKARDTEMMLCCYGMCNTSWPILCINYVKWNKISWTDSYGFQLASFRYVQFV